MNRERAPIFMAGAAEVDITPPVGTSLAGSLKPRQSVGIQDPLYVKAIALESGGERLCCVLLDLICLPRAIGDAAAALASKRTGIPASHIVWFASHTHTGPYTADMLGDSMPDINRAWLDALPLKFADAVEKAAASMRPARMSRERAYCFNAGYNRRLKFKGDREINRWLLHRGEDALQSLGSAGPIDPEIGILCFDDEQGNPIAILWNHALHANRNFGLNFSADFPGVVAARIREKFGCGVVTLFMPGACGDINPLDGLTYRQVGDTLANAIIARLEKREPRGGAVELNSAKRDIIVPWRDPADQDDSRVSSSQWDEEYQNMFRAEAEYMKQCPEKSDRTIIQAWRIGEVAFVGLPGEAFAGLGLEIKGKSPFAWTYPVELAGDYLGYLVTEQAWTAGGYESLVARLARPSVNGVKTMTDTAVEMLQQL